MMDDAEGATADVRTGNRGVSSVMQVSTSIYLMPEAGTMTAPGCPLTDQEGTAQFDTTATPRSAPASHPAWARPS
jgi:hypothetical protein